MTIYEVRRYELPINYWRRMRGRFRTRTISFFDRRGMRWDSHAAHEDCRALFHADAKWAELVRTDERALATRDLVHTESLTPTNHSNLR
jgi:hypothetical protein